MYLISLGFGGGYDLAAFDGFRDLHIFPAFLEHINDLAGVNSDCFDHDLRIKSLVERFLNSFEHFREISFVQVIFFH